MAHEINKDQQSYRFLKVFVSALVIGVLTGGCVRMLARRQVLNSATSRQGKIFTEFMQASERNRKSLPTLNVQTGQESATSETASEPTASSESPYWAALREVRKQFPYFSINLVLQGTPDGDRERTVLEVLKSRSREWAYNDEREGWARTFFVLPTRNTAALHVQSDVRDDLFAWDVTAGLLGFYVFGALFTLCWVWSGGSPSNLAFRRDINRTVQAFHKTTVDVGHTITDLKANLLQLQLRQTGVGSEKLKNLDDMAAQIRLLAVNGSLEASRSPENFRVFQILMQEINQLASQIRSELKPEGVPAEKAHQNTEVQPSVHQKLKDIRFTIDDEKPAEGKGLGVVAFRRVG